MSPWGVGGSTELGEGEMETCGDMGEMERLLAGMMWTKSVADVIATTSAHVNGGFSEHNTTCIRH